MDIPCSSPMCTVPIDVNGDYIRHGVLMFCSDYCRDDWVRTNELFKFAAQGAPLIGRRPTKPKNWYEKDG